MERIGGETMVLYSDLLERLDTFEAMRNVAHLQGEIVTKTVKGTVYYYFQAMLPTGRTQIYLGPDNENVRRLIVARRAGENDVRADVAMLQRLSAQIMAGGIQPVNPDMAKVISRLADSGVFRLGGVLVGTIGFVVIGTHLGVIWGGAARMTQDVDIAADTRIALAVPNLKADVPNVLDSLEMGFFPVPRLSPKEPSTRFAVRGKTLRVDILTPMHKSNEAPVPIRRLNTAAEPLRFLDFLIEDPISAVMIAGTPCLVRTPQPARYALHKLIVSQERDATAADKKKKDLKQAEALFSLLRKDRPGDIQIAWEALSARGHGWVKRAQAGAEQAGIDLSEYQ